MGAALKQISLFSLFSLAHVFVPKFDLLKYDGVSPPLPIFFSRVSERTALHGKANL